MNPTLRTSLFRTLFVVFNVTLATIGSCAQAQSPGVITNYCVTRAVVNTTYITGKSGSAVWMPKISTNLIFLQPGSFTEYGDGTATLTGTVRSLTNFDNGFTITVNLSGYTTKPPSGSPKKDLDSSAYINNGGPVDPSTWHYYTNFSGTFTGFGLYANAILDIVRYGPSFQVGIGASGKNVNFGAGAWFTWYVRQQPTLNSFPTSDRGDLNLDFGNCDCPVCDLLYP